MRVGGQLKCKPSEYHLCDLSSHRQRSKTFLLNDKRIWHASGNMVVSSVQPHRPIHGLSSEAVLLWERVNQSVNKLLTRNILKPINPRARKEEYLWILSLDLWQSGIKAAKMFWTYQSSLCYMRMSSFLTKTCLDILWTPSIILHCLAGRA